MIFWKRLLIIYFLLLIYDDIDLSLGTLKFKEKGFSGGHKGVENVIYQLGSNEFPRLKLGIANEQ